MNLFHIVCEKEARRALAHVELDLGRLRNPTEHIAERVRERDMHIEKLEDALREIVAKWHRRSDHFRDEADCAAGLADIARITLPDKEG